MKTSVHLKVTGYVQGVSFRYFTQKKAHIYNIHGWVKNIPDGSVEIEAEGSKENMEEFVKEIKQGPSFATVSEVVVNWKPYQGFYNDFQIR